MHFFFFFVQYQDPPKTISEAQGQCRQRLVELKKSRRRQNMQPTYEEMGEKDKHEKLIGQLKWVSILQLTHWPLKDFLEIFDKQFSHKC